MGNLGRVTVIALFTVKSRVLSVCRICEAGSPQPPTPLSALPWLLCLHGHLIWKPSLVWLHIRVGSSGAGGSPQSPLEIRVHSCATSISKDKLSYHPCPPRAWSQPWEEWAWKRRRDGRNRAGFPRLLCPAAGRVDWLGGGQPERKLFYAGSLSSISRNCRKRFKGFPWGLEEGRGAHLQACFVINSCLRTWKISQSFSKF